MTYSYKNRTVLGKIWSKLTNELGFNVSDNPWLDSMAIDEPLTLYVETTGSDSNDGTQNRPFKTIQRAIDFLKPYTIKASVTIQVGVGTFDGFIVELLNFRQFANFFNAAFSGSGNTNGVVLNKGARCQIASIVTSLGATNEIVLDGVNHTLANMRAASPKLLTNTYGTIVYE